METEKIIELIDEHLQSFNSDKTKRIEKTKELLDFLNYNLRLTELSEEEKKDFVNCMEGYPLSEKQREVLEKEKDKNDYYISTWARSTYFRRCAWLQYLHGEISEKPYSDLPF